MSFKLKEGRSQNPNVKTGTLTIVLDGYNAPVSAGNFLDLVQRKFYDGMEVQRSDGFVVQSVRSRYYSPAGNVPHAGQDSFRADAAPRAVSSSLCL